jgi:UDP-glucose:glycoprotein glucosyltransferase
VNTRNKIRLSGYGVELAIKSTEYKAKDDTVITGTTIELFHVEKVL